MATDAEPASQPRRLLPLGGLGLLAVAPWIALRNDHVRHTLLGLLEWFQRSGALGMVAFVGWAFCAGSMAFPIVLVSAMAGFVWGFARGYPIALLSLSAYSLGGWALGRIFQKTARERLLSFKYGPAVASAMGKRDFKLVALMRMTPLVPQNLLGPMLSGTPARLRAYVLASVLGLAPITALHSWVGSQLHSAESVVRGDAAPQDAATRRIVTGFIACASVLGIFFGGRAARRAFEEALRESEHETRTLVAETRTG